MEKINLLITIALGIIAIANFVFYRKISKFKSYENMKGENLATKEDIAGITKEIESVKNNLQIGYSLDNEFIQLIVECLEGINQESADVDPRSCEIYALSPLTKLNNFLHLYKFRYASIASLNKMIELTDNTFEINLNNTYETIKGEKEYIELKREIQPLLKETLSILLPVFDINKKEV